MHVYFVRHGETEFNAHNVHQAPNVPLSSRGREDSRTVGEFLRSVNPDLLITSTYTRALETARVIGFATGITPSPDGRFREIERPSALFGTSHFSLGTLEYVVSSLVHWKNPTWHYKDAENFTDVKRRAEVCVEYLRTLSRKHQSVVIVSHTIFIDVLVSFLCKGRMLNMYDLTLTFLHIRRIKNGGVVHLVYEDSAKKTCAWKIVHEV